MIVRTKAGPGALAVALIAVCGLWPAAAMARDWPQWRGPEQTGVSRERNLPEQWSLDGQNLLWKNKVGGMSSPIVMNGRVYTMTRIGDVAAEGTVIPGLATQEAVACIDAQTGQVIWQYHENLTQTEVPFHRIAWSNVVGDPQTGRIYALMVHCSLVCLDAQSGKLIWKRQLTEEFGMISTFGGRTPSPALDEDQVFVCGVAFGWGDHARSMARIFAFNKHTGELNWTNGGGGIPVDSPYNTPVISVIDGQRLVIFGGGDGGVHAFKARTGEKVWSFQASKRGLNASVVVDGNRVFVAHSEENLDTAVMGRIVCLDATGGQVKELWRIDGLEVGFSTPTIFGGRLYAMDNGGTVYALDANTGKEYWRRRVGTIGKASLVYGDGKLYVGEANGRFVILRAGETRSEIISREEFTEKPGREYVIFGSPAIANGRIYLQTADGMYCIGPAQPTVVDDPIPPQPTEEAIDPANPPAPAWIQVRPADLVLEAGQSAAFTAWAFDAKGRSLGRIRPQSWSIGPVMIPPPPSAPPGTAPRAVGNLKGQIDGDGNFTSADAGHQGGAIIATAGGLTGLARVRVLPPLPWRFDFQQAAVGSPPLTWIGAGGKFAVADQDGNRVLVKTLDLDLYYRARTNFGLVNMRNYTVQADVKVGFKEFGGERHMPDPGILNSRYVLTLLGNHQRVQIHVWPSALPYSLNRTLPFSWEPDRWYTMKLRVDQRADSALVRGKVWPAGQPEPAEWTIELEDAQPNREGNPGLFGHSLVTPYKSEIYYDNITVEQNK
jgi:outer membrane protein assembly factor BamB